METIMDIHSSIMDVRIGPLNHLQYIHRYLKVIMCLHDLIIGIQNSVMDIVLEDIFALGFPYKCASIASQWIHEANNDFMSKKCCDFVWT